MGLFMGCQIRRLGEPFCAVLKRAYVRLFARMGAQVCPQVKVQRETFFADVAFVRFLPSVHELVSLKL